MRKVLEVAAKWLKFLPVSLLSWIPRLLLSKAKLNLCDEIFKQIDKLDELKPLIADLIRRNADPDKSAERVVSWTKNHLRDLAARILTDTLGVCKRPD